jgi:hypothetical protein
MPPKPTLVALDKITDGAISRRILSWRDEGLNAPEIAFRLRTELDIQISERTAYRWLEGLSGGDAA